MREHLRLGGTELIPDIAIACAAVDGDVVWAPAIVEIAIAMTRGAVIRTVHNVFISIPHTRIPCPSTRHSEIVRS
jgi:hypothetical protein